MESIDIVLLDPNTGEQFQFPVNPARIQVRGEAMVETVEIARLGEVDWPSGNRRTQVSWESFFPGRYDPSFCRMANPPDPLDARDRLTNWRVQQTALRLIITGEHGGRRRDIINASVLLTTFSTEYRGGEPRDLYYEINFRQYRQVLIRSLDEVTLARPLVERIDVKSIPTRYTVQAGDTLWHIAKAQLGAGERWEELYQLNRAAIGPDYNLIQIGMELLLPGAGAPPQAVAVIPPIEETPRYPRDRNIIQE